MCAYAEPAPAPAPPDTEAPVITVIGKQLAKFNQVPQCSEYVDEGAVATDNVDSDELITSQVGGLSGALKCWGQCRARNE